MTIDEIAAADPRLGSVWAAVTTKMAVREERTSGSGWGSHVNERGVAVITTSATKFPAESLAHELLHLRTQLAGYRRLKLIVWPAFDPSAREGSRLLSALDNELQHHRMFPEFAAMGFDPHRFYADDDVETYRYLRAATERFTGADVVQPVLDFLTLIAPGGHLTVEQKRSLRQRFRYAAAGAHANRLASLDTVIEDWRQAPSLDAEPTVRRIIRLFEHPAVAWVGYGEPEEFPSNGFFVDEPFEFASGG